ncbi:methylmalonyl Co-A mutase-associated GTPase MeaB [Geminicoccaceae bacterium 1502E]|nr:methylmalonyl Co-A mutase-associated GTPase MeaB [Geminicoccaceae bacterium 1502E]
MSAGRPGAVARRRELTVEEHVEGVLAGERAVLSRTITLVESRNPAHQRKAQDVLGRILPHAGNSRRIGITGVPGVGKSTFIDAFGTLLTGRGHKVAVLAVDPSSTRTGGSILGDKTRMARLATDPAAYIRPSASGGTLGGVGRMTRETMLLCEAAGYDVVLVETVGVGQSEVLVAEMVDFFLALMLPGAGDELQGIKKGLLEIADMIAVNKADGDNRLRAAQAARHYRNALHIIEPASPSWRPSVATVSALSGEGLEALWLEVEKHHALLGASGELADRRRRQQVRWMWGMLDQRLHALFRSHPRVREMLADLEHEVASGSVSVTSAVERLIQAFISGD